MKKILVAVDGSYCSLNEINYLAGLFTNREGLDLHLMCIVTANSLPVGSEWMSEIEKVNILSPQGQQRLMLAKKHVNDRIAHLVHLGFREEQLSSSVPLSRGSVAADLLAETRRGRYDALLVGRRGLGKLQALVMGSVTQTILEKCYHTPLWIVDGEVDSRRILVPVDGSVHTLRAVDHLSFMLAGVPDIHITLFHSSSWLASDSKPRIEAFYDTWDPGWCDRHLTVPDAMFHAPEQILRENGFDMTKVKRAKDSRGLGPASHIALQLRHKKYGTIVMGRRGPDEAKGILGGVSDRVLGTVNNVAVWLTN